MPPDSSCRFGSCFSTTAITTNWLKQSNYGRTPCQGICPAVVQPSSLLTKLVRFPNSVSMYMHRGAFYQHRMHRPFLALKMYSKAASISKVILDQILCRRGMDSVAETQESSEGTHVLRFESNLALARKQDAEATNTLVHPLSRQD